MREIDPSSNGDRRHHLRSPQGPAPGRNRRGSWVVLVAVVSASTGLSLFAGGAAGGLAGTLLGFEELAILGPVLVGAAAGGLGGVWVGAWVATRFTPGGRPRPRILAAGAGGTLGLAAGVALSAVGRGALFAGLPVAAVLAPGVGAAVGEGLVTRRQARGGGPPAPPSG